MTQKFSGIISFLRTLPREAGMTMAEMAVTMGLIGLGALGAASLGGNVSTGSKKLQGLVAMNSFATSLNTHLYSNMGCLDLKQLGALSVTPTEITLTTAGSNWNYQGLTSFQGGYTAAGDKITPVRNFDIASLQAYYENDPNPAMVADATGASLKKGILKIKAVLKVGKKPSEYVYNVPVLISDTGAVSYCSDEKNLAETCAAAQGEYNPATQKCDLGTSCKIKDTYNQLTCFAMNETSKTGWSCSPIFGASKTNQYTGTFACPANSTASQTSDTTWVSQRDCGKKCTQNISNRMVWVTCIECPPASP